MEESRRSRSQNTRNSSVKPLTVDQIEDILADFVADAAAVAPAKVLARDYGMTDRHVRALRQREHFAGGAALVALAQQAPELSRALARLLGWMPPTVAGADQALAEIHRIASRAMEEGDQEQPV